MKGFSYKEILRKRKFNKPSQYSKVSSNLFCNFFGGSFCILGCGAEWESEVFQDFFFGKHYTLFLTYNLQSKVFTQKRIPYQKENEKVIYMIQVRIIFLWLIKQ